MANTERRTISVFIASPGDLAPERKAFKDTVDELNEGFADGANVKFVALGWEEVNAESGRRVQDVINYNWKDCDLFILALNRRWGQKAKDSKYSSYTEEEFRNAFASWKATGKPEVLVFFKTIDSSSLDDPGMQLKKVLKFRRELEESHEILIRSFSDTAAFVKEMNKHLRDFARGEWAKLPAVPAPVQLPAEVVNKVLNAASQQQPEAVATPAAGPVSLITQELSMAAPEKEIEADLSLVATFESELALARSAIAAAEQGKAQLARLLFAKAIAGTTDLSILGAAEAFYEQDNDPDNAARVRERAVAIYENRLSACLRYQRLQPAGQTDEIMEVYLNGLLQNEEPDVAQFVREAFDEVFGHGRLQQLMVEIMANFYTDQEIQEMTRFLASPAGQASIVKQPLVTKQAMAIGQQRMQELIERRMAESNARVDQEAAQAELSAPQEESGEPAGSRPRLAATSSGSVN